MNFTNFIFIIQDRFLDFYFGINPIYTEVHALYFIFIIWFLDLYFGINPMYTEVRALYFIFIIWERFLDFY